MRRQDEESKVRNRNASARVVVTVLALVAALASPSRSQPVGPPFPRIANMYLQGSIDDANIPSLARWDVLILDSGVRQDQLQRLRTLNPSIKIFLYVCGYCMQSPPPPAHEWLLENYAYVNANDLWWRNWNRTIASDWPGAQLVNVTDLGAAGPQGTWRTYIAARVERLMRDLPEADGVFYDNFWKSIGWQQGGTIQVDSDCNPTHTPAGCNGQQDSPAALDTLWNHAMRSLAQDTRTRFDAVVASRGGRPLGIVTNSSSDYFPYLNGTLHEYFPSGAANPDPGNPYGYNWNHEMLSLPGGYLVAPFRTNPYRVSVLNADWEGTWSAPTRSPEFERHKRFTLVSALLGDGYYSLDAAETGHGSLWWEPEYDHAGRGRGYLGYPTGAMQRIGVPSGAEKIINGGFDAMSTAPWDELATNVTGSFSRDTSTFHSAPASGRINITSVTSGGSFKLYQNVAVVGGRGYSLRFWARASTPQEIKLHLYSSSCPGLRCLTDTYIAIGTTWEQHEVAFTASGTSAAAGLNLFFSTPGNVWVDDVSLREGDTSVFRRDFDAGVVLLNYTNQPQTVDLGGTFQRLSVPGSPVFNGAVVTMESVPPSDGRILLRVQGPGPDPDPDPVPPPPGAQSRLFQNEPNPFNPSTRIRFVLGRDEHVHLAVYDIAGRLVCTLLNRRMAAGGTSSVDWNGTDRWGQQVRSGVYFYRITTPTFSETRKLTLLM